MSTAHVVQCNDMVVCVVIGSEEEANARVEVERQAYFESTTGGWIVVYPKNWNALTQEERRAKDYEAYKQRCYWRAREVPLY